MKRTRGETELDFIFDHEDMLGLSIPTALEKARIMAISILLSAKFREVFIELVDYEVDHEIFGEIIRHNFIINLIRDKSFINYYAVVCRQTVPWTIYLNPTMLLHMSQKETLADLQKDSNLKKINVNIHSWFLAIKLVHVVSHLLHGELSERLDLNRQLTPERSASSSICNDLGSMIEKKLFGGVVELKGEPSEFMPVDQIGWYPSPETKQGRYFDAQNSTYDPINICLGGNFTSKRYPFVLKVALNNIPCGRASSGAMDCVCVDCKDSGDDDEVELGRS